MPAEGMKGVTLTMLSYDVFRDVRQWICAKNYESLLKDLLQERGYVHARLMVSGLLVVIFIGYLRAHHDSFIFAVSSFDNGVGYSVTR